nr:CrcB family protein [Spelaeicoccus albus]
MRRRSGAPVFPPISHVLLVIVGGVFGTAARAGLSDAVPAVGGWPVATAFVNLAGAFLLGIGLEGLARRGPDVGRRRVLRLMIGTGFMGAFTTYSTLAVETGELFGGGDIAIGLTYAIGSVLLGTAAAAAGIWTAAGQHRLMQRRRGPEWPGDSGPTGETL